MGDPSFTWLQAIIRVTNEYARLPHLSPNLFMEQAENYGKMGERDFFHSIQCLVMKH